MIPVIVGRAAVTIAAAARCLHHCQVRRIGRSAHCAVGQVGIQGEAFAAMAAHTAETLDRVRIADLWQIAVAGQAILSLAGQGGYQ